jgi:hypothetical protein
MQLAGNQEWQRSPQTAALAWHWRRALPGASRRRLFPVPLRPLSARSRAHRRLPNATNPPDSALLGVRAAAAHFHCRRGGALGGLRCLHLNGAPPGPLGAGPSREGPQARHCGHFSDVLPHPCQELAPWACRERANATERKVGPLRCGEPTRLSSNLDILCHAGGRWAALGRRRRGLCVCARHFQSVEWLQCKFSR